MIPSSFISRCGVCDKGTLEDIWDLPRLPLTEKFGQYAPEKPLHFDQKLVFCANCGHVQLGKQISPQVLYTPSEYTFRTSLSSTARKGAELFYDFFQKMRGERKFKCLLDIGGNDLYLAKMVDAEKRIVVDPVCAPQDGQVIDNVLILGRFIEEVDFQKEGFKPDLVFCRHVLEHLAKPTLLLKRLFQECAPHTLFVFEIPCFENLVEANRFDAIFHQHYHYFDLTAFRRLILEANGTYVGHIYNRQGSCGGSLLIAFSASQPESSLPSPSEITSRKRKIQEAIATYKNQMELLAVQLQKFRHNIYGYGASLMLATLAYHLHSDLSELICVLDDDPQKENMGYENLPVKVRYTGNYGFEPNRNYLITSLENTRPIFSRMADLAARRVLMPVIN